jgi:hypothetical protein
VRIRTGDTDASPENSPPWAVKSVPPQSGRSSNALESIRPLGARVPPGPSSCAAKHTEFSPATSSTATPCCSPGCTASRSSSTPTAGSTFSASPHIPPQAGSPSKPAIYSWTSMAVWRSSSVAVGTALAGGPPHGSRRAELPHRAPASGSGCKAHVWVGMHRPDFGEPSSRVSIHPVPVDPSTLASSP